MTITDQDLKVSTGVSTETIKVTLASLYLDGVITQEQANKISDNLGVGPIYHIEDAHVLLKVRITSTSREDHPKNVETFMRVLSQVDALWKNPLSAGIPAELIEIVEDIEPF